MKIKGWEATQSRLRENEKRREWKEDERRSSCTKSKGKKGKEKEKEGNSGNK